MPDETMELLERKLALLLGYAGELDVLVGTGHRAGAPANTERRAIERLVQLLVEVTVDSNGLIAAASGLQPPATARESFLAVRDLGVITGESARRFISSYVGVRNRIVHDYDRLDDLLVRQAARRLVGDARGYAKAVGTWVRGGK